MELDKNNEFKSPPAALLWSIMMPGFGQFYNGQYIFGALLFVFEMVANGFASLNTSILHSFHGEMHVAHDTFSHQWGMYYPSVYAFGIWQAYNRAIVINKQHAEKETPRETYLTGFFIAFVVGMNIGVYYHHTFLDNIYILSILASPIFNGLFWGIIFGIAGHFIEKYIKHKKEK